MQSRAALSSTTVLPLQKNWIQHYYYCYYWRTAEVEVEVGKYFVCVCCVRMISVSPHENYHFGIAQNEHGCLRTVQLFAFFPPIAMKRNWKPVKCNNKQTMNTTIFTALLFLVSKWPAYALVPAFNGNAEMSGNNAAIVNVVMYHAARAFSYSTNSGGGGKRTNTQRPANKVNAWISCFWLHFCVCAMPTAFLGPW